MGQHEDPGMGKSAPPVLGGGRSAMVVPGASVGQRAVLIAVVAFVSYAYFYEGGGWNQNSRFDLVRAILDEHTLRIDAYHENTGDKALYQGHYYSDKAPGQALLAVPAAAASRPLLRAVGVARIRRQGWWRPPTWRVCLRWRCPPRSGAPACS